MIKALSNPFSGFFSKRHRCLEVFLFGALIAASFMLIYIIRDGGPFFFYGDFNVQQIPFYIHANDMIRNGLIGWDHVTDLGVNFVGSYSFYLLGSPFFLLTLLFPAKYAGYSLGFLYILKFACASLTGYLYIQRFLKNKDYAMIGGLLYAFSGFSVYNVFFNHFHEAIVFFPLLLIGMEMLVDEGKIGVFGFAVFINAAINYYFFFGEVVFCVLYYIIRCVTGGWEINLKKFGLLALEAVIGLLMSSVILLPSLFTVLTNSRVSSYIDGWNTMFYGSEQRYGLIIQSFFFPPDNPARPNFFPNSDAKWSSVAGWLPLFSMVGVISFMKSKKKNWIKRMIGWCIFFALIPFLNAAFSAFNYAYYARWFYMPVLIMCLATAVSLEDEEVDWNGGFVWTTFVTLFIALTIGFLPKTTTKNGEKVVEYGLYAYKDRFFLFVGIAIFSLLLLWVIINVIKRKSKWFTPAAIISIGLITCIYANSFIMIGRSMSYDRTWIKETLIDNRDEIQLPDSDKVRVDVYPGSMDNIGLFWNMSSICAFHSVVPASIMDFYNEVGVDRVVGSRPEWDLQGIRSLLSVKYLIDPENKNEEKISETEGWTYYDSVMGYTIYTNDNYIPMGFTYDRFVTEAGFEKVKEDDRGDLLLQAILLTDEQIEKYGHLYDVMPIVKEDLELADSDVTEPYNPPSEPEAVSSEESSSIPSENENTSSDDTSDESSSEASSNSSSGAYSVPSNIFGDYLKTDGTVRTVFTDEMRSKAAADRNAGACYEFNYDDVGFNAKINLEKEELVFFSVPWEEGWSATVNGKEAQIEKVNLGFMAVLVPAGQGNEIQFTYETPYLKAGALVSLCATGTFAVYIITAVIFTRRRKRREEDEQLAFKPIVTAEPQAIDVEKYSIEAYNEYMENDGEEPFDFEIGNEEGNSETEI